jgi:hypothetical protein
VVRSGRRGFRSRLGFRAGKLYEALYGEKRTKKVRANVMPSGRNRVRTYPRGILEQAYRELVAEGHHQARTDRDFFRARHCCCEPATARALDPSF